MVTGKPMIRSNRRLPGMGDASKRKNLSEKEEKSMTNTEDTFHWF